MPARNTVRKWTSNRSPTLFENWSNKSTLLGLRIEPSFLFESYSNKRKLSVLNSKTTETGCQVQKRKPRFGAHHNKICQRAPLFSNTEWTSNRSSTLFENWSNKSTLSGLSIEPSWLFQKWSNKRKLSVLSIDPFRCKTHFIRVEYRNPLTVPKAIDSEKTFRAEYRPLLLNIDRYAQTANVTTAAKARHLPALVC